MKDLERKRLEMFVRVADYGETHGAAFAPKSRGAELFATVRKVVEELQAHAATQAGGAAARAQGTASREAARDELSRGLQAVGRTARAISPAAAERFRRPGGGQSDQQLLATARDFATAAAQFQSEFERNGLDAKFFAKLGGSITALEEAISEQNRQRGAGVTATESIDAAVGRGLEAVRALDALVRNKFADDPAALAAWTSASHVERTRRAPAHPPSTPPASKP